MNEINSITILGREWWDKVNGNSYFSCDILVNGDHIHKIPYEYGYGDQYRYAAAIWLDKNGYISLEKNDNGTSQPLWSYCRDNNIVLYCQKFENQRKRDLK